MPAQPTVLDESSDSRLRRIQPLKKPSSFFKLYAADVGVTGIHSATLGVSLPAVIDLPVGTFRMNGHSGFDAIFYGTAGDEKFYYEIVFYQRLQSTGKSMWVPLQMATSAVDNLIGAETGLDGEYVEDEAFFADTVSATVGVAYHGQGWQDLQYGTTANTDVPNVITTSSSTANGIGMLHCRNCLADAVRIHPYTAGLGTYTSINVMARRVP